MRLYDYMELVPYGNEVTVFDKKYDIEVYFYGGEDTNEWYKLISELEKKLSVSNIINTGVVVNLSEVIENNLNNIVKADLFVNNNIECIMTEMENILAGSVSENWMKKFVGCLSENSVL